MKLKVFIVIVSDGIKPIVWRVRTSFAEAEKDQIEAYEKYGPFTLVEILERTVE